MYSLLHLVRPMAFESPRSPVGSPWGVVRVSDCPFESSGGDAAVTCVARVWRVASSSSVHGGGTVTVAWRVGVCAWVRAAAHAARRGRQHVTTTSQLLRNFSMSIIIGEEVRMIQPGPGRYRNSYMRITNVCRPV